MKLFEKIACTLLRRDENVGPGSLTLVIDGKDVILTPEDLEQIEQHLDEPEEKILEMINRFRIINQLQR